MAQNIIEDGPLRDNVMDALMARYGLTAAAGMVARLKRFPREDYCLATKYPGHQIMDSYHPKEILEEQLKKCDVDYFVGQKRQGRIRHLGFSCHGSTSLLEEFLDKYGDKMEFCQIQLNCLDWTLQDGKGKYRLLTEKNIPIWVMEPVRGGKLAAFDKEHEDKLKKLRPEESVASWAFRWLQDLPNVKMILSGMSNMERLVDNIHTFERKTSLRGKEEEILMQIADSMKNSLPCTGCRYYCDGCPKEIDIPKMIGYYNEMKCKMRKMQTCVSAEH